MAVVVLPLSSALLSPQRSVPGMLFGSSSQKARAKIVEEKAYDYIIAGGGTAGCVLANRLTEDGTKSVLMLEAGEAQSDSVLVKIPVAVLKLFKSKKFDWNFATEPAPHLDERSIYLCRGKGLGGSSLVNVMLYTRGAADDFDKWADACDDPTWKGAHLVDYFKKAENYMNNGDEKKNWHGTDGPSAVSDVPYVNPLSTSFLEATEEAGYRSNDDFNDWSKPQDGFGRFQVSQKRGRRESAYSAYLSKEVRNRENLDVVQAASVAKINFNKAKAATGVDVLLTSRRNNNNGKDDSTKKATATLKEKGEVILTAGAIGSPQILQLSGVGDPEVLSKIGVDAVAERPGVGLNLQDHPACLVSHFSTDDAPKSHSTKLRIPGTTLTNPVALVKWLFAGRGPLTSPGCDHGGFLRSSSQSSLKEDPDVQMRFLATKSITPDGMSTIADEYLPTPNHPNGFTIQTICARPVSNRGKVVATSSDPLAKPKIETPFFSDTKDLEVMVDALKKARGIMRQPALRKYAGPEEFPGPHVTSDDQLRQYAKHTVHTANALVGTCKLGTHADDLAVVDNNLKVIGVNNLRVCDSSVMPVLPGGQTASSTLAVAEKAADILRLAF